MHRFSLIALLALVGLACAGSYDRSLYLGHHERGEELIQQKEVDVDSLPFIVQNERVSITGDGEHTITYVEIIDLKKKKKSATPRVTAGGPGQTFINIQFESARGHGIRYLVKVYGKD